MEPSGGYKAVLPTIVLHPTNLLGQGSPSWGVGKSSPAREAAPYLQLPSLPERARWWQQQVCPQQPCWLQPTTLAGEEATAQPSLTEGKHPAHGVGEWSCAGVAGRSAARRSCLTKTVSHKKSRARLKSTSFSTCQRQTQEPRSVPWGLVETVKQIFRDMLEQS